MGLDPKLLEERLSPRWDFIHNVDVKKHRDEALERLDLELAKERTQSYGPRAFRSLKKTQKHNCCPSRENVKLVLLPPSPVFSSPRQVQDCP